MCGEVLRAAMRSGLVPAPADVPMGVGEEAYGEGAMGGVGVVGGKGAAKERYPGEGSNGLTP